MGSIETKLYEEARESRSKGKERSASSRIRDYLRTFSPGAEFTCQMIEEALTVSTGSVSGFLHKLQVAGIAKVVGISDGRRVYTVIGDLDGINVREVPSSGTRPGRSHVGVNGAKKAAELLRQIADDVEKFKSGLESYSTEELLREVMRRERSAK